MSRERKVTRRRIGRTPCKHMERERKWVDRRGKRGEIESENTGR